MFSTYCFYFVEGWVETSMYRSRFGCDVLGFQELIFRVENSLEGPVASRNKRRQYSTLNLLRRDMVGDNPFYSLFVSESSTGYRWAIYRTTCHRDVFLRTRGAGDFDSYFATPQHWHADVIYRVHNGLRVYGRLRDLLTLSAEQEADYLSQVCRGCAEGFSFSVYPGGLESASHDYDDLPRGASSLW